MIRLAIAAALCVLWAGAPAHAADYVEPPMLQADVSAGQLPPVEQRLPDPPRVVNMAQTGREAGRHGGTLRMLMGKQKDIRMMTVFSYARLVGFDRNLELVPDILESCDVEDGRIFTLKLRRGHRWSDGEPFTSEDFRYVWEDVLKDEELGIGGIPSELIVDGKEPRFEVVDETTVRYVWDAPNPNFLPALAAPRPLQLVLPAHYMKQFHARYQEPERLAELVAANSARNWRGLHIAMSRHYRPENPDLPVLDPWRNTIEPPSEQFIFVRNPYFHRVDEEGRQLPYIDKVVLSMGSTSLIPAKAGSGESDLQARYIRFDNYTFLKQAEDQQGIRVHLWLDGFGSRLALLPNLNTEDPDWKPLLRDARFRKALSLGIIREELNQVIYFGLGQPSADTLIERSPLYKEEYRTAWIEHDPERANRLLDEIGLTERGADGIRLLPSGKPAHLIVETAGESTEQTDGLELIADHLKEIGIKLFVRPSQRDVLRSRVFSGDTVMSVWTGLDNAVATAQMSPQELSPFSDAQLQWPRWGQYYATLGQKGEEPDLEPVKRLGELNRQWGAARDKEEQTRIWHEMLNIYTDHVYSIGTVNSTRQPVVRAANLRNVPEEGIYSFMPGSYFGIYDMASFWFDRQ